MYLGSLHKTNVIDIQARNGAAIAISSIVEVELDIEIGVLARVEGPFVPPPCGVDVGREQAVRERGGRLHKHIRRRGSRTLLQALDDQVDVAEVGVGRVDQRVRARAEGEDVVRERTHQPRGEEVHVPRVEGPRRLGTKGHAERVGQRVTWGAAVADHGVVVHVVDPRYVDRLPRVASVEVYVKSRRRRREGQGRALCYARHRRLRGRARWV